MRIIYRSGNNQDRQERESLKAEILAELRSEIRKQQGRSGPKNMISSRVPPRELDNNTIEVLERLLEAEKLRRENTLWSLEAITDPYVHRLVDKMARQDMRKELSLAELIDLLEHNAELGRSGYLKRNLRQTLSSPEGKSFFYGAGSVLLLLLLLPALKDKTRKLLVALIQGTAKLSEQASELVEGIKEDLEDIIAEAQFENIKKSIDQAIITDDKQETT